MADMAQSMLDAPIWLAGRTVGVICNEHVGGLRQWEPDEEYFAASLANAISLALDQRERRRTEEALKRSLAEQERIEGVLRECEAARGNEAARVELLGEQRDVVSEILAINGETLAVMSENRPAGGCRRLVPAGARRRGRPWRSYDPRRS